MEIPVQPNIEKKQAGDLMVVPAAGLALCLAVSVAARLQFFWQLSRIERAAMVGIFALVVTPLLMNVVGVVWRRLQSARGWNSYVLPILFVLAGITLAVLDVWPVRLPYTLHQVEVSFAGPAGTNLRVLEVRGAEGNAISAEALQFEGAWDIEGGTFVAPGGQTASIEYQFYGPDRGDVKILMEENPSGGTAAVRIDRTRKQVNLNSNETGSLLVEGPLMGESRAGDLVRLAWFATVGLVLPFALLAVVNSGDTSSQVSEKWAAWFEGADATRHIVFVAAVLLLLVLPLRSVKTLAGFDKEIWGREPLLRAFADFRHKILRDQVFNSLVIGSDDWLVYTGELSLDDYQNTKPLTNGQLAIIQAKLDGLQSRLNKNGVELLFVIPPNKNTIYPERVPGFIPRIGSTSRLDQILSYQQEHGQVQVLDLRPALMDAKAERPVYYSTDTHWNPYGAHIAYYEIVQSLESKFPGLRPYELEQYRYVSEGMQPGDIGAALGQIRIDEEFFKLEPEYNRPVSHRWDTIRGGAEHIATVALPSVEAPRMVMYHDSFGLWLIPFLSDHFSQSVFVRSTNIDEPFIYAQKADIVILEVTERYIENLVDLPVQP